MDEQYLDQYLNTYFTNLEQKQNGEKFVRDLIASHLSHIPQKLYKYRECNDNNFESLRKKEIYVPYADSFPDPFDYTLNVDLEAQKTRILQYYTSREIVTNMVFREIEKAFSELHIPTSVSLKDVEYVYDNFVTKDGRCLKKKFEVTVVHRASRRDQKKYQMVLDQMESFLAHQVSHIKEVAQGVAEKTFEQCQRPRKENRIYCMSEKNDCGPMWEHYANNYSGCCIEYDFCSWETLSIKDAFPLLNILPVIYKEKRIPFDMEPFFELTTKQFLLGEPPTKEERLPIEIEITKHFLIKQSDYSYEKEWRLILMNHKESTIPFPFVSAIYLGRNISQDNENVLIQIAKRLNARIFKQKMSFFGNELRFEEIKR